MSMSQLPRFVFPMALVALLLGCRTSPPPAAPPVALGVPSELLQQPYLFEIVRYLYRWDLDESEVERVVSAKRFVFWVRRLEPKLDPGDRSWVGEILLPQIGLSVKVKKADYRIGELGITVKSQNFKITKVTRAPTPSRAPQSCEVVAVDMKEMRDYLFRTRNQHDFPDPELVQRLREALRKEAAKEGLLAKMQPNTEQIVHVAPLSPVANEIWVFWEAGRKLFHFASDIDLANPEVWRHEVLAAHIYDLDQQVVVSHEEAPGSNRFLTRYQVSRALFNCFVFGQRITVPPYVAPGSAGSGPGGKQ